MKSIRDSLESSHLDGFDASVQHLWHEIDFDISMILHTFDSGMGIQFDIELERELRL